MAELGASAQQSLDQVIDDLVSAARSEARAAALGLPHLVRVPAARHELQLTIAARVRDATRSADIFLSTLDQVLAGPAAHALALDNEDDRARLRELVATALANPNHRIEP